jgi:predicted RND superfamily exporter protein
LFAVVTILFLCFRGVSIAVLLRRALPFAILAVIAQLSIGIPGAWATVVALPLALAMMTTRGVLLPSAVVAVAVVWTWGLQGLAGLPIYIAGTLVPPLLLAIGCADGIHVLERYFDLAAEVGADADRDAVVIRTMTELWRPIVLTSVTTAIGFGSLMLGSMTVYRVFGFTTAFGILVAMVVSLTLLPAVLALLPLPVTDRGASESGRLAGRLRQGAEWIEGHRKLTLGSSLAVLAACAFGTQYLVVDYSWVESLAPGSDVLHADRVLRERHGGTMPMNIIVRASEADGMKDPELLLAIDNVLVGMAEDPLVGDTRSIAEYIARMNQAMNEDRDDMLRIPETREMVAQYLLVYAMSGDPGEFDEVVDYDYSAANASILLRTDRLSVIGQMVDRAEALLDVHVRPLGATATITGAAKIQHTVLDMILVSQIYSLATATVLVFLFMSILFRSLVDAAICMIPSLVTGVVNFGAMGALGLPLGPDKAMISAIALGIGIDYSIHLMARFHRVRQEGPTVYAAIVDATQTTGRAVVFNAAVVVAGFLVLGMSESPSNASFGLLIASNMAVACVSALVIVPVALTIAAAFSDARAQERPVVVAGRSLQPRTLRLLGLGSIDT